MYFVTRAWCCGQTVLDRMWNGRSSCASSGPSTCAVNRYRPFPATRPEAVSSPASPSISLSRVMRFPQRDGGNASTRFGCGEHRDAHLHPRASGKAPIAAARASSPCPRTSAMESNGHRIVPPVAECGGISGSRSSRHLAAQFWAMSRATAKAQEIGFIEPLDLYVSGPSLHVNDDSTVQQRQRQRAIAAMASGANVENLGPARDNGLILPPRLCPELNTARSGPSQNILICAFVQQRRAAWPERR